MLLSDFVYVGLSYQRLVPVFLDPGANWLCGLPSVVSSSSEHLRQAEDGESATKVAALMRLGRGPKRLRPLAIVSLGRPRRTDREIIVPLRWDPVALEFMLPRLEGDLVVGRVDSGASRLELRASYAAPLAKLGEGLDRLAMHRAAEAGAREFLHELAAALDPPVVRVTA